MPKSSNATRLASSWDDRIPMSQLRFGGQTTPKVWLEAAMLWPAGLLPRLVFVWRCDVRWEGSI